MNKRLAVLIIIALVLIWKFVLFPSKLEFTDRAKVLHGLSLARDYKTDINDYWKNKGVLPTTADWDKAGSKINVDLGKSLVKSIQVGEDGPGTISVYYTNARDETVSAEINGKKLVLTPAVQEKQLKWKCNGTLPAQYVPAPCR